MVALFSTAATLSGFFNSPISGKLLQLEGFKGVAGWQWLFLIEGIPAVLVGILVLCILPDGPGRFVGCPKRRRADCWRS